MIGDSGLQALTLQQMLDRFAELAAAEVILGNYKFDAAVQIKERAASATFTAAYGQLWIKSATPAELWFADDAGAESQVMIGAAGPVAEVNDLSAVVTWANVPQANIPDPLLQAGGSASAPSYSFSADPDTGIYASSADQLAITAGGIAGVTYREASSAVIQVMQGGFNLTAFSGGGQGSALVLLSSYNVVDTVAAGGDSVKLPASFSFGSVLYVVNDGANAMDVFPASGDDLGEGGDTALSVPAGDSAAFLATSTNGAWVRLLKRSAPAEVNDLTAAVTWANIPQANVPEPFLPSDGVVGAPAYSFAASPTSGWYSPAANKIALSIGGAINFQFRSGKFEAMASNSPIIVAATASSTVPTLCPGGASSTGIGNTGGSLSLIATSAEGMRFIAEGGFVRHQFGMDTITATPGGGAGGYQLKSSYNLITVVASAGDSVRLHGSGFDVGALQFLTNTGANACDVFPFPGDDIGAGTNLAISLPAGKSVAYMATASGIVWTKLYDSLDAVEVNDLTAAVTWANVPIANIPDPLQLGDGAIGAPSYGFASDVDTGMYLKTTGQLGITVGGTQRFQWRANNFETLAGNSPMMLNETVSSTNPGFAPHSGDPSTGLGAASPVALSLIANATEGMRLTKELGGVQISYGGDFAITALAGGGQGGDNIMDFSYNVISVCATTGDSVRLPVVHAIGTVYYIKNNGAEAADVFPGIGDDLGQGTNLAESLLAGDGISYVSTTANTAWTPLITPSPSEVNDLTAAVTWANVPQANIPAPLLVIGDGSASDPAYAFANNSDMGMFRIAGNVLGLSVAGIEAVGFKGLNSGVVFAPAADLAISATAGGGAGGAGVLKQSYNVIGTVATTGDSVTLPAVFVVNSIVYIKNDGANSADVFPASGDDLGQGTDTAEAVAAGASVSYVATTANATWTPLVVRGAGETNPVFALKTDGYTLVAGDRISIEVGTAKTVTVAATIAASDEFIIHNSTASAGVVSIEPNTGHNIIGISGDVVGGTDTITLGAGETLRLLAVSATLLEII